VECLLVLQALESVRLLPIWQWFVVVFAFFLSFFGFFLLVFFVMTGMD